MLKYRETLFIFILIYHTISMDNKFKTAFVKKKMNTIIYKIILTKKYPDVANRKMV